jgi:hypothetical protein
MLASPAMGPFRAPSLQVRAKSRRTRLPHASRARPTQTNKPHRAFLHRDNALGTGYREGIHDPLPAIRPAQQRLVELLALVFRE